MLRKANKIFDELNWERRHRTMLVVQVDGSPSVEYDERAKRFVDSLNRPETIKADVFILFDGLLEYVDGNGKSFSFKGKKAGGRSVDSLRKFAKQAGYTQICILLES